MVRVYRFALFIAALVSFVMAVLPHPLQLPGQLSDKILHIFAFAVLGALAAASFPKRTVTGLALWLTAFGALIEAVQAIPALNRDSELLDLMADAAAAFAAAWLARRATAGRRDGAQEPE